MLKNLRLFFIALFSLIILTCDSGDNAGGDIPSTDNYENEISLTFSGNLSNFRVIYSRKGCESRFLKT